MWGGFDFGLKEALERAKHDLEKSVDSALGIEEADKKEQEQKNAGGTGPSLRNGVPVVETVAPNLPSGELGGEPGTSESSKHQPLRQPEIQRGGHTSSDRPSGVPDSSSAPAPPPAAKKSVKKVARKLVSKPTEPSVTQLPSPDDAVSTLPVSVPAGEPAASSPAAEQLAAGSSFPSVHAPASSDPAAASPLPADPPLPSLSATPKAAQAPTGPSALPAAPLTADAPPAPPPAGAAPHQPAHEPPAAACAALPASSPGTNGMTKSSKRRAAAQASRARAQQAAPPDSAEPPQAVEAAAQPQAGALAVPEREQQQGRAGGLPHGGSLCAKEAQPKEARQQQLQQAPAGGEPRLEASVSRSAAGNADDASAAAAAAAAGCEGPAGQAQAEAAVPLDVTAHSHSQAARCKPVHPPVLDQEPGNRSPPTGPHPQPAAALPAAADAGAEPAAAEAAAAAVEVALSEASSGQAAAGDPSGAAGPGPGSSPVPGSRHEPVGLPQPGTEPSSAHSGAPGATPTESSGSGSSPDGYEQQHDLSKMSQAQVVAVAQQLRAALASRQQQMVRQAEQMSQAQEVIAQLTEKNEELVLKTAKISEQELEEMRAEFEKRLGAAERKVYALTKERDALKRGNEKLGDYGNLLREKDDIIKQVMMEGERLAGRQAELESTVKKLRQQSKEMEAERARLTSKLADEEAGSEALRKARAKLERDVAALGVQHKAELDAQKQAFDAALQKAKVEQSKQEERAREAANSGLSRRLKEAESRCEAFSETVMDLREALDRQRQAANLREEMLKQDLADLEQRCQAAELRHQDLAAKLPDTARPLLRQIEAMQAAAEAQQEAWTAAEATLNTRIADAEARAAGAVERERHTAERTQAMSTKLAGLEAALASARAEVRSLTDASEVWERERKTLAEQLQGAQRGMQLATERCQILGKQLEQTEGQHASLLAAERSVRAAAESDAALICKEYERRISELEAQLGQSQGGGFGTLCSAGPFGADARGAGEPPAMAAPGYRWVLQKDQPVEPAAAAAAAMPPGLQQQVQQEQQEQACANGGLEDGGVGSIRRSQPGLPASAAESSTDELLSSLSPLPSGSLSASQIQQQQQHQEGLRSALRARVAEVHSLEAQVKSLEATRDRLAEELVQSTQKSEQAADMVSEIEDLRSRYTAAVEMLGERDEVLEELRADLQDVKNLYRDQIEFMVMQLVEYQKQPQQEQQPLLQQP